jgi:hypothetical protein
MPRPRYYRRHQAYNAPETHALAELLLAFRAEGRAAVTLTLADTTRVQLTLRRIHAGVTGETTGVELRAQVTHGEPDAIGATWVRTTALGLGLVGCDAAVYALAGFWTVQGQMQAADDEGAA